MSELRSAVKRHERELRRLGATFDAPASVDGLSDVAAELRRLLDLSPVGLVGVAFLTADPLHERKAALAAIDLAAAELRGVGDRVVVSADDSGIVVLRKAVHGG